MVEITAIGALIMETIRFRFEDNERPAALVIDIPCSRSEHEGMVSDRALSFFGELTDEDGDLHPLAVRYDGTVSVGFYGNEDTRNLLHNATLKLHGKQISPGALFELRSKNIMLDLQVVSYFNGEKWLGFGA